MIDVEVGNKSDNVDVVDIYRFYLKTLRTVNGTVNGTALVYMINVTPSFCHRRVLSSVLSTQMNSSL